MGFAKARFKKFSTREEAQAFLNEGPRSSDNPHSSKRSFSADALHLSDRSHPSDKSQEKLVGPKGVKKPRRYFENHVFKEATGRPNPHRVIVYTDGSCFGNGTRNPVGGYGIHWPATPTRDRSGPLPAGSSHTNQKAELIAVREVLREAQHDPEDELEIRTDSHYVIKGLCEWSDRWLKNGFEGVQNAQLFKEILELGMARPTDTWVRYVPAHAGEAGNERADELARLGSQMNPIDLTDS